MEMTFCTLKNKDVINICDGRNYGTISDLVFDTCCGKITGIIVPASKSFLNFFKANNDLFIPYNRICKIGKDIILVDIIQQQQNFINDCFACDNNFNQNNQNQRINIQSILNNIDNNNKTK